MIAGQKPKVLVVDDEPGIRETLAALLEDEGYLVSRARDGMEALSAVENRRFDVILTDVRMPRLDGMALVRRLRERGDNLPIVLMSAVYADANFAGLTFVRKPFDIGLLLDRIEEAIAARTG